MKYLAILLISTQLAAQSAKVDLAGLLEANSYEVVNRQISHFGEESAVALDARPGDGMAILKSINFQKGVVQIDLLGENNPGRSFIGFAFNIQNDSTYEAIYFRPFNFVAKEKIRREHMVQYINHPEYTWKKLRETRTGEFENEIESPPDPDSWFRAKLVIEEGRVLVFVEGSEEPCLDVERIENPASSVIGLWTGFNSSGRFRNLELSDLED